MYNYVVGLMARSGARGLGPGLGLKYDNCVAGRAWTYFLRAGPGPGLIIQFGAGPGPGLHNCCGPGPGLGLKSYFIIDLIVCLFVKLGFTLKRNNYTVAIA